MVPTSAILLSAIIGLTACAAGASPTPSPSSGARSPSEAPSEPAPTPTIVPTATPVPTPEPIVSTSATFSLLPADPPAGFESTITCEGDIGASDPVAVVSLKTADEFVTTQVLRDYADIEEPRTVCTFGELSSVYVEDLIDARHILVNAEGIHAVVDLPEVTYHWFALPAVDGGYGNLLTVSPTLDAVVWRRGVMSPMRSELVITTAAGDTVVAELPAVEGGRCGAPTDSNLADYQLRGARYYVLDQIMPRLNALVVASGAERELEHVPPAGGSWPDDGAIPLFPIWSPTEDVLFYRIGDDVMRWTPESGEQLFMADTPWFQPSMTADGRYLAYVVDADLYLIDFTTDASPELIREDVEHPVFVNGSQLWFRDATGDGCAGGEPPPERIYDVRDGSEAPSVIKFVQEVWPQTSSNH